MDDFHSKLTININNKFILIGILLFTIGTFTLDTFLSSGRIKVLYLIASVLVFIIYYLLTNRQLTVLKVELLWLLFIFYFLFNFMYQSEFKKEFLIDLIVFAMLFVFLLLVKIDIKYFYYSMLFMLMLAVVYAFSSIFQFINMDLYSRIILPRFNELHQIEILRLYNSGSYTGFTRQTAYISGYLVFGIALAVFLRNKFRRKSLNVSLSISIFIMLFGLFLGSKRAHLAFMILSFLITYLFSTNIKKFFSQLIKVTSWVIIGLMGFILLILYYTPNPNSPIGKMFYRFTYTIEGFLTGDDITGGRTTLYKYAIELFNDNPIFGIGWRKYNELTFGLLSSTSGSHPHNIYLQLLTELGIIGLILFVVPIIYSFIKTLKLLMYLSNCIHWKIALQFSLFVQSFFILYGMTGNLLTDHMYLLMYVFALSITLSAVHYSNKIQLQKT